MTDDPKIKLSFCLFEAGSALNKVKCEESVEKRNNSFIFGKRKAYISIDSSRKVHVIADFRKTKQCWEDSKIGWATFPIFNNEGEINYGQWKLPLNCYPINFEYSPQNGTTSDYNKFIFFRIYPNYTLNTEQLVTITLDDSSLMFFSTFKEVKKTQNDVEQPKVVQPAIVDILPDVGKKNTVNIKKKSTLVKQEVPKTIEKSIVSDKKDSQKLDDLNQTKKDAVKQFPIGFQFVEINNLKLVDNPTIILRVKLSEGDSAKSLFETKPCEPGVIENQYGWEFNFYIETFVEKSGRKAVLEIVVDYILNCRRVLASGQFEIFKYHFKEPFDINDGNQSISFDGEIIGKPTLLLKIYKPKFGRPVPKKFVPKLIVPSCPEEAYFYKPVESSNETDNELSSINISIDAGRFLPDNSTASRISGSFYNVRTKSFSKKIQIATKIDLDTSVYNPEFKFSVTITNQQVPPFSILVLELQTIDILTKEIVRVGYSYFTLFFQDERIPQASLSYNMGLFQLPVYYEPLKKEISLTKSARVPCTTVLVRVTSSEVEASPYSSKVYQTYEYEKPQESDLNLYYFVYAQKKSFSVRDRLLAMGNLPKSATQTEEGLLAWTSKLFEATNEIPRSIDLAFICKYDATYGFKVSIDKAESLEWKGFTIAVISFSTSPFKRGAPLKSKNQNDILYTKITNLNSEYKNPEFDDGYFGWTACPIFHPQKYVRMGKFKLPLFEGDMDVETLSQYSSFEDSWGEEGELTLTNTFSSITIRVVDGRRDGEITKESMVSNYFLGTAFNKFKRAGYSNLVKSLIPRKTSKEEYVENVYTQFLEYTNLPIIP
ncbi:Coiled-coil domain-containing protein 17 [Boothiomyces macroporosus]|uniref:Coiled-coil domain-containing protein 17 n=1 Tax=Boothiomyces macroporosus TaxID=261099 RepID=A0AAD5UQS8_9FUNG|nr:Coiled-coil domain-containing protein 17 [Boothiomyces macroporosus]